MPSLRRGTLCASGHRRRFACCRGGLCASRTTRRAWDRHRSLPLRCGRAATGSRSPASRYPANDARHTTYCGCAASGCATPSHCPTGCRRTWAAQPAPIPCPGSFYRNAATYPWHCTARCRRGANFEYRRPTLSSGPAHHWAWNVLAATCAYAKFFGRTSRGPGTAGFCRAPGCSGAPNCPSAFGTIGAPSPHGTAGSSGPLHRGSTCCCPTAPHRSGVAGGRDSSGRQSAIAFGARYSSRL